MVIGICWTIIPAFWFSFSFVLSESKNWISESNPALLMGICLIFRHKSLHLVHHLFQFMHQTAMFFLFHLHSSRSAMMMSNEGLAVIAVYIWRLVECPIWLYLVCDPWISQKLWLTIFLKIGFDLVLDRTPVSCPSCPSIISSTCTQVKIVLILPAHNYHFFKSWVSKESSMKSRNWTSWTGVGRVRS